RLDKILDIVRIRDQLCRNGLSIFPNGTVPLDSKITSVQFGSESGTYVFLDKIPKGIRKRRPADVGRYGRKLSRAILGLPLQKLKRNVENGIGRDIYRHAIYFVPSLCGDQHHAIPGP